MRTKLQEIIISIFLLLTISLQANTISNLKGELSVNQGILNYNVPLNLQ